MKALWHGETDVCSHGPGHMTKMAAITIYGISPLRIFMTDDLETWCAALGTRVLPNLFK